MPQEPVPALSAARQKELDDLMMRMTDTDWLTLMMQVGSDPALARELLGADVTEDNFIEHMNAVKDRKKRALVDLRYRARQGKPMKPSKVTEYMRVFVKGQWSAAHNGTITMAKVKAMNKQQLEDEYKYICRRLEKDRLLSAQHNLFRPKPTISEPLSKRQRVSSQLASDPAATTLPADDPNSAGGVSSDLAGSVTPMAVSAAPLSAGGTLGTTITVSTIQASGGLNEFFLDSDVVVPPGVSRVAAEPDSDDEVLAKILFRGKSVSTDGVVFVDTLPDDEIVDPRVKEEPVSESPSSPSLTRRKHLGVTSGVFLYDGPVEEFLNSESDSDDDDVGSLPYSTFKDWEMVPCPPGENFIHVYHMENRRRWYFTYLKELVPRVYPHDIQVLHQKMNRFYRFNTDVDNGLDLWRDVNILCNSLHADDLEEFWRDQDDWIVSSWKLYPKSTVHVLDLTNGKTVYMFMGSSYPIRATLLERMLRHRLTVPPSYCCHVRVGGLTIGTMASTIVRTIQDALLQATTPVSSAPMT
ncbi:hypothetical protein Tco_0657751 [Tanacetum coccineum]